MKDCESLLKNSIEELQKAGKLSEFIKMEISKKEFLDHIKERLLSSDFSNDETTTIANIVNEMRESIDVENFVEELFEEGLKKNEYFGIKLIRFIEICELGKLAEKIFNKYYFDAYKNELIKEKFRQKKNISFISALILSFGNLRQTSVNSALEELARTQRENEPRLASVAEYVLKELSKRPKDD